MKRKEEKETIQVHKGVYSSPIYEMEVFTRYKDVTYTDDSYKLDLQTNDWMQCNIYSHSVGLFPTVQRGLEHYDMITEDEWEGDEPVVMLLRQKPMICLMKKDNYIKEWTYVNGILVDESLVRNYDEDYYRYDGRPKEMIHHKVGDIVQAYYEHRWIWGVVIQLPPSTKDVAHTNELLRETDTIKPGDSYADWENDGYFLQTNVNDNSFLWAPAHRVIAPTEPVPEFVKGILDKGYKVYFNQKS